MCVCVKERMDKYSLCESKHWNQCPLRKQSILPWTTDGIQTFARDRQSSKQILRPVSSAMLASDEGILSSRPSTYPGDCCGRSAKTPEEVNTATSVKGNIPRVAKNSRYICSVAFFSPINQPAQLPFGVHTYFA